MHLENSFSRGWLTEAKKPQGTTPLATGGKKELRGRQWPCVFYALGSEHEASRGHAPGATAVKSLQPEGTVCAYDYICAQSLKGEK